MRFLQISPLQGRQQFNACVGKCHVQGTVWMSWLASRIRDWSLITGRGGGYKTGGGGM